MDKIYRKLIFIVFLPIILASCSPGKQVEYYRNIMQKGDSIVGRYRITPAMAKKVNCFKFIYDNKRLKAIELLKSGKMHNSFPFSMTAKIVIEEIQNGKKYINKDANDNPATDMHGIYYYTWLNKGSNQVLITNYNQFGTITENTFGMAQTLATLDKKGLASKSILFDKNQKRLVNRHGMLYEVRYVYDKDDNIIEMSSYDQNNKLVNGIDDVAKYKYRYNEYGNIIERSCHGVDGQLKDDSRYGVAITRCKYDERDNLVELSCYGINDQLRNCKDGYAIARFKYDAKGDCIETSCYGRDEKPKEDKNGTAISRLKYDDKGNAVETSYYGVDGKLKENTLGVASQKMSYDKKSKLIELSYYGTDGKLKESKEGYAIYRAKYDEKGNLLEEETYGIDNNLKTNKEGIAITLRKYDEHDNCIQIKYCDANRQLKAGADGVASYEFKYDKNKNIIEKRTYNIDGKLKNDSSGIAIYKLLYDKNNNLVELAFFDEKEQLITDENGIAIRRFKYDVNNRKIEESFYGTDDNLKEDANGVALYRYKYDENGNIIEKKCYGIDYDPKEDKNGTAMYRYKNDDQGNIIEGSLYGKDNKLKIGTAGFAILRNKYDSKGNKTEVSCYGIDDKLKEDKNGIAIYRQKYDETGKVIESNYYGSDGKLITRGEQEKNELMAKSGEQHAIDLDKQYRMVKEERSQKQKNKIAEVQENSPKILRVKGLYLEMDIDEGCKVVSSLLNIPYKVISMKFDKATFGVSSDVYYVISAPSANLHYINLSADANKKVVYIGIAGSTIADMLFNTKGVKAEQFVHKFMTEHGIPSMEPCTIQEDAVYSGWGFTSVYGYFCMITDNKAIIIKSIPQKRGDGINPKHYENNDKVEENEVVAKLKQCPVGAVYGMGYNQFYESMWQLMAESLLFKDAFGQQFKTTVTIKNTKVDQYDNQVIIKLMSSDPKNEDKGILFVFNVTNNYQAAILSDMKPIGAFLLPPTQYDLTMAGFVLAEFRKDLYEKSRPSEETLKETDRRLRKMLKID